MKRVYYIDTFSTGYLHEMFNAAALVMFAAMYDHVEYRTSRSSFEHVKALLGYIPENVSVAFIPTIEAYRGGKRLKFLLKQLQAVVYNSYYILTVPKGNDLVFNFNTLAALPMMNRCAFHTQNKVLQICHGELVELAQPASRNLLLRRGLQVFRSDRIAPELYFAVLGSSIYSHVAPFLSEACRSKLLQFEHPAIFPAKTLRHERYDGKLIFGTIGSMRESKGIAALLELAGMLKDNPQVELRCIGKIDLPAETVKQAGIVQPADVAQSFLTREEMYRQISMLDYALFLFPPERYKFTASGSVFDAIACETPVIALQNDYFEHLFAYCGDFGYLENSIEAISRRILSLAGKKQDREFPMERVKNKLNPITVAKAFVETWQKS